MKGQVQRTHPLCHLGSSVKPGVGASLKVPSHLDSSCHLVGEMERNDSQTIVESRANLSQILGCLRTSLPSTSEFSNLSNLHQA